MKANPKISGNSKPNLHKRLFWDWKYDAIDWQATYLSVIARVVERGTNEEIEELIRYYGSNKVLHALLHEIVYLPDYVIIKITHYFSIQIDELACCKRKKMRKGCWI